MSAAPAITKTLLGSTLKLYGIGGFRPEGVNFAGRQVSGRMAGRTRKLLKDKNHRTKRTLRVQVFNNQIAQKPVRQFAITPNTST